ncbi:cell division protein FtsQ/DivIB [Roseivirga sp.]|uniref:cell division protein FtsQ/DivIB n=1 Tax=Roseivirga sp. TaxID=1964215 RepID=UPI003B52C4E8
MKQKETVLRILGIVLGCVILIVLASSVKNRDMGYHMEDIDVEIENAYENFFVDADDVMALIMQGEGDSILGDGFNRVSLKDVESRIESHSFVKDAEVYRDLKGHLVVKARQNKPVARLMSNRGDNAYIGEDGEMLPVSSKYTARVPVVTGQYVDQLMEFASVADEEYAAKVFELINFVNAHKFWTMQIGQIDISSKGYIVMYPQVGDQRLEFGYAEDIERKFKKLEIFFKQIMPTKGWNTYSKVNVEYKDQIICD